MKMLVQIQKLMLVTVTTLLLGFASGAHADGGGSKYEESPLNPIYKMLKKEQYDEALAALSKEDQKDADVLNLIGYSNRKLQNYDAALDYYQRALAIKPKHKGANEYLGQLYVETGQIDKAKERLAVLDGACFFTCKEYKTLKKAIDKAQ